MKNILITLLAIISFNCFSQKEVKNTLEVNTTTHGLGNGWKIQQVIKNDVDTTTFFYMAFQNIEYTYITDIGSVFITNELDLVEFCNKLIEYANTEKGKSITEVIGLVSIKLIDSSDSIFIIDNEGKFTSITKKKAIKLAEEILNSSHLLN